MREVITEIQIELNDNKKRWIIKRNDYDPDTVGDITTGPYRARDLKIGTKYITKLIIED